MVSDGIKFYHEVENRIQLQTILLIYDLIYLFIDK